MKQYDIVILGGGPGGYVAALYAAQQRKTVAIVENNLFGGTCLNCGCIPTKVLLHIADEYAKTTTGLKELGINVGGVSLDWDKAINKVFSVQSRLRNGTVSLLKARKAVIYEGMGAVLPDGCVEVALKDGTKEVLKYSDLIIATGSKPGMPPISGCNIPDVVTSNEVLKLGKLPESMLIIGGGIIGVEFGYAFRKFGVPVTIIEMTSQLLPGMDVKSADITKKALEKLGVKVLLNTRISKIEKAADKLHVFYSSKNEEIKETVSMVVAAIGRVAVLPELRGVDLKTENGGLAVDEHMRTNIPHIYAVGDVTQKQMLANVASQEGIVAVKNILGESSAMNYDLVPNCVYITPESASIGLNEQQARDRGLEIETGIFPFTANSKAVVSDETEGFVKIVCGKKHKEVLGIQMTGPKASELLSEAILAMNLECTANELIDALYPHPTLSEAMKEAALDVMKTPIHKI